MQRPARLTTTIFIVLMSLSSSALAQEAEEPQPVEKTTYALDGDSLKVTPPQAEATAVKLPCLGLSLLALETQLYVACGDHGAVVLSLADPDAPSVSERRDMGGFVQGFFVVDGQVWARISTVEAKPLTHGMKAQGALVAEVAPEPEKERDTPAPEPTSEGEVAEVRPGEVVITIGAKDGVAVGDNIELFSRVDEDLGGGQSASRENMLAVGVVTVASEGRSVVKLGLGESVEMGSLARSTAKKRTNKRLTPPRVSGLMEVEFNFRPFLALGTFGFGMVSDGSVGYRFGNGFHASALFEPVGLGFADEGNIVATAASLVAAYDTPLFEVGLGLGRSAINDSRENISFGVGGDLAEDLTPEFDRVRSGLSIVQTIRLGALDGLHLEAHNAFLFYKDEFHYGGTNATFQIPVSDRSWLILRGGGGIAGYGYGEIGLRVLLKGNGNKGSIFLTPRLGGAGLVGEVETEVPLNECFNGFVDDGKCVEEVSYAGPMIGIGLEWRP